MKFVWMLALLLPVAASALQAPTPTLRSETRVVQIDISVRDAHGLPVNGLTKEDFTVRDQGKPRAIVIFGANPNGQSGQPADAIASPPQALSPPTGVFSNRTPSSGSPEHVTVILLDGILGSFDDFRQAQQNIIGAMTKLPATERVAIYTAYMISPYAPPVLTVVQDFTSDRDLLRKSISAYRPPGALEPAPAMPRKSTPSRPTQPQQDETTKAIQHMDGIMAQSRNGPEAMAKMDLLREIGEHLALLPGRKNLIWVTPVFPPVLPIEHGPLVDKTVAALNDANVAINPVDMHGMVPPIALRGMQEFAERTGGQVYYRGNDIGGAIRTAVEASRTDYTLGFYLADSEHDGAFHKLTVQVDRPGVELRYRQGYIAEPASAKLPAAKDDLDTARLNPVDANAIGISVRVETVPGQPQAALDLTMSIDSQGLSLRQDGDASAGKVDEKIVELDEHGAILGQMKDTKLSRIPR